MLRKFVVLLVVLLSLGSMGCSSQARIVQAQTANAIAQSTNDMLPWILESYNEDGMDALKAVKAAGGGRLEAVAAINDVKRAWKPVWQAWDSLQLAHDKWATMLEEGADTTTALRELKDAYCKFRLIFPKKLPVIPLGIIKCEEQKDEQGSSGSTGPGLGGSEGGVSRSGPGRDRREHHVDRSEGSAGYRGSRG